MLICCPHCAKELAVNPARQTQIIACNHCRQLITIPPVPANMRFEVAPGINIVPPIYIPPGVLKAVQILGLISVTTISIAALVMAVASFAMCLGIFTADAAKAPKAPQNQQQRAPR